MGAPIGVGDIIICAPPISALGERLSVRILLYGTGASLAGINIYIIPPVGDAFEISDSFVDVSSSFPATFISQFQTEYTFKQRGLFIFLAHDTASGNVFYETTYCAQWASRIDQNVSDVNKQRADLQRIYGKIK